MSRRAAVWAVVPAAGRGERFAGRGPKQYVTLLGRPLLGWSLAPLLGEPRIRGIAVAVAPGDRSWRRMPESRDPRVTTCRGGARRELSVAAGLEALADRARDDDWALVHDAARPCLAAADLRRLLRELRDDPVGGLLAAPVADTLKLADGAGGVRRTVPREGLWRALTPQMFRFGLLRRALGVCIERGRPVTDEAAAVEALGLRPRLVHGLGGNLKVTIRPDLNLAEAVLRGRR